MSQPKSVESVQKSWKKLWESETGLAAIAKIEQLKQEYIDSAMNALPTADGIEQQRVAIHRAQGVNEVLNLIRTGLYLANQSLESNEAEGGKKTKK